MKFRVARHTDSLENIVTFYTDILGLQVLDDFKDHDNYNGVFIGFPGADWHLEFTTSDEAPAHKPDADDLLVFYASTIEEYNTILQRFTEHKIRKADPKNPYWKTNGTAFLDPDGYGIIIALPTLTKLH